MNHTLPVARDESDRIPSHSLNIEFNSRNISRLRSVGAMPHSFLVWPAAPSLPTTVPGTVAASDFDVV
jgi:hypothetical protein